MNFKWDLKKQIDDRRKEEAAKAQLRKRSKDSVARPRAEKNITTTNPELQRI